MIIVTLSDSLYVEAMLTLETALEAFVTAFGAYAVLVLVLRLAGKRVLSKWNAFDLVVTVAFGSSLATAILSEDATLLHGVVAFLSLALLQLLLTSASVRWPVFERVVKARPTLLFAEGEFLHPAMRRERVTESEVQAAIRARGIGSMSEVAAVVLETDGEFSVIDQRNSGKWTALNGVDGAKRLLQKKIPD